MCHDDAQPPSPPKQKKSIMKTTPKLLITALTLVSAFSLQPSTLHAQGTAFSYQGRLNDGGSPATGIYDLRFTICDALANGNVVAGPNTSSATGVTNGLFAVTLDFGSGVFTGSNYWVEIAARTNGAALFATLSPRQPISPVPYAIMANSASNLLGTLPSTQVSGTIPASQLSGTFTGNVIGSATSATTATTANNFSGSLAGDVTGTQGATVVSTVGGSGAANIHAAEQLANAATTANTASAIVKRDASGNFSAGTLTLSGTLNLPATPILYANYSTLLFADDNINFYAGPSAGSFDAGIRNTGIGGGALYSNVGGSYNTANGYNALGWNSTGSDNTAVGFAAMFKNTSGSRNTAIGETSLEYAGGSDNIAIGYNAGVNIGLGNNNIDIGNGGSSSDNQTIHIGTQGNQTNTFIAGIYNNVVSAGKPVYVDSNGQFGTSASSSVALLNGNETFTGVVTFNNSGDSFTGNGSGLTGLNAANVSGTFTGNVIGSATSATTATTANNFSGSLAGDVTGTQSATVVSTVGSSTAVNIHAAEQAANAATSAATASTIVKRDGSGNFTSASITLNGNLNLPATTATAGIIFSGGSPFIHAFGNNNFFAGSDAGNMTMTGTGDNTGVGYLALYNNTSGYQNTAIGFEALAQNTGGYANTASGVFALNSNTGGSYNTANGYDALAKNTSGYQNTANGFAALNDNINGSYNTASGFEALFNNSSGSNNIALGYNAGYNLTTGSTNIDIGNPGVSTDNNIIRIGSGQASTYLAGNSVHVPGMLRLGSETNTASGPSYPSDGLIIRRISSTFQTVSNLVARTDALMLTRDGTGAGLAMNYSIVGSYYQNIVAIGIDYNGVQHLYKNTLTAGSGTLFIFNNSLRIVHYDVSFGNVYNSGHTCHVILDRYDDGSISDYYMVGYLTSTYNQ
jgi:hypothetical protein